MAAADGPLPLAGLRVLITRPQEQAAAFAEALARAGATPIVYPTIELAPPPSWQALDQALGRLSTYGWTIFTSPSAVTFTLDRCAALGIAPGAFAAVRIAAVGDQTALALRRRGLIVDLVPAADQQRQEGLVAGLLARSGDRPRSPARILFPQAVGGRELLRDQLVDAGYVVDVVPVSQTLPRALSDPPPAFDVATFASPSALRAFVDRLGSERLALARVAVIGPTTAQAAASLGVRVDAVPATPSVAALVEALIDLWRQIPDEP